MSDVRNGVWKVLIVEDDERVSSYLKRGLSEHAGRVEVHVATNAGNALSELREFDPHVVVLDIMLPYGAARLELDGELDSQDNETGLKILEWIAENRRNRLEANRLWVEVVTARGDLSLHEYVSSRLREKGVIREKPISYLAVQHDIEIVLGLPLYADQDLLPPDHQSPTFRLGGEP